MEVWQKGFSDRRIRDASDYRIHVVYMRQNPARKNLCERAEDYPYSSAHGGFELDGEPQGLKPIALGAAVGAARAAPSQNKNELGAAKDAPLQSKASLGTSQVTPSQDKANKTA